MLKAQKGFTLIELIVVIVILGILSATALPKFVDLGGDARLSVMKSMQGAMHGANAMIYAKAALGGQTGATGSVTIAGAPSAISLVYGYAATATELIKLMDISDPAISNATANTIVHTGAPTAATCTITYTPATSTATPQYSTPTAC